MPARPPSPPRSQLVVVPDQHDLRYRKPGLMHQPAEPSGVDHAGLVDHQHVMVAQEPGWGLFEVDEELGQRRGGDPGGGLELVRGPGREPQTPRPVAACRQISAAAARA